MAYKFYESEVSSKYCIRYSAALSANSKTSSLAQEVVRRLLTTSEWITKLKRSKTCKADRMVNDREVMSILETFNVKLIRSGYSLMRRQEIFKAGLLGYKRKMLRTMAQTGGQRHRIGADNLIMRKLIKATGKGSWYKKKGKGDMKITTQEATQISMC